jgi:hypothetical protein
MKIARKTERDHVAKIAELEKRVEGQSLVIQTAAKDAVRSHTVASASFCLAAAADFLLQGGEFSSARHVLHAIQVIESNYQRAVRSTPQASKDEEKKT